MVIHREQMQREVALPPTPRHWSLFATVSQSQRRLGEVGRDVNWDTANPAQLFSFWQPAGCHLGHWSLLVCSPIFLLQLSWSNLAQQMTGWGGAAAMSSQLKTRWREQATGATEGAFRVYRTSFSKDKDFGRLSRWSPSVLGIKRTKYHFTDS